MNRKFEAALSAGAKQNFLSDSLLYRVSEVCDRAVPKLEQLPWETARKGATSKANLRYSEPRQKPAP